MVLNSSFYYIFYLNLLLLDSNNNKFANSPSRDFFKSSDSFFTSLVPCYTLISRLVLISNTQINRYINKDFQKTTKLTLKFFFKVKNMLAMKTKQVKISVLKSNILNFVFFKLYLVNSYMVCYKFSQ